MNMEAMIDKYFRPGRLPHIWCPGCGNGVVTGTIVKAVAKLDLDKDKVAVISGIGCSSRASGYLDFNTVHSAHGRALPVATGATFVARGTTFHAQILADLIAKGIEHKGFSLIEAVTACPISYGRQNKMGGPADMMKWQRDHAVPLAAWDKMTEEQKAGKFPIGVLYQVEGRQEYTAAYDELIARAQGGK